MKLSALLERVPAEGEVEEREITSLSQDSRAVRPGGLFAALTQDEAHIRQALDNGAAAVLCKTPPPYPGPWLTTEDPRLAWALLCANWFGRPGEGMTLVAVTGTNGKTTTTSLLKEVLEGVLHTRVGLIGTNRNLIGDRELPASRTTPDSYELQGLLRQMADSGCTHVVLEASSHALVQRRDRKSVV